MPSPAQQPRLQPSMTTSGRDHLPPEREAMTEMSERSRRLVHELTRLRELEARKRLEAIGSPAFERLADDVVSTSRRVFEIAAEGDTDNDVTGSAGTGAPRTGIGV